MLNTLWFFFPDILYLIEIRAILCFLPIERVSKICRVMNDVLQHFYNKSKRYFHNILAFQIIFINYIVTLI